MMLFITIPGKINTNHRPRATARGGKVRTYKDAGYRKYLEHVRSSGVLGLVSSQLAADGSLISTWRRDLRYSVVIVVHEPDRRSRDLDNFAKPILDGLTGVVWFDDRQIDDLHIRRGLVSAPNPNVFVSVEVIK